MAVAAAVNVDADVVAAVAEGAVPEAASRLVEHAPPWRSLPFVY